MAEGPKFWMVKKASVYLLVMVYISKEPEKQPEFSGVGFKSIEMLVSEK